MKKKQNEHPNENTDRQWAQALHKTKSQQTPHSEDTEINQPDQANFRIRAGWEKWVYGCGSQFGDPFGKLFWLSKKHWPKNPFGSQTIFEAKPRPQSWICVQTGILYELKNSRAFKIRSTSWSACKKISGILECPKILSVAGIRALTWLHFWLSWVATK